MEKKIKTIKVGNYIENYYNRKKKIYKIKKILKYNC